MGQPMRQTQTALRRLKEVIAGMSLPLTHPVPASRLRHGLYQCHFRCCCCRRRSSGCRSREATACVFADIDLDSPHVRTFKMLYAPGGLIRAKSHCHL